MFKLNEEKYKEVILYLAKNVGQGGVYGKKKMYKLLYYVDFDFFEKYEKPITGDIYHKLPMGPAPSYFDVIALELKKEGNLQINKSKSGNGYNDAVVYKALTDPKVDIFSKDEKKMLDRVIKLYGDKTGHQLEILTHKEAPYLAVDEGEGMPLEFAHYRGTSLYARPIQVQA
ncbi:hypothetical protein A2422_01345 [Candidatus Woesebacteria bacterium RIFOXYC1_FULL_31_51]|uniref:Helix-turn-helix domain protein n=1 Tax=Candidatus Woesebacteria bacterium GW2011_GWC2_31_9 TaxID=1618586 RepID=A0A0F9YJR6_9BACT|nr:MAG: helix-turN-helix domain protein [Candidatus Woesebacteria bacterium GW2011_GWF1_31_35]KKP22669.1 MAG: Helix-turn-helix domain protein [Candidatus Woesebacteria bacterium GW2011_GWC1_30_29]KKP25948.1 MAG: Helix-turn-helix domain protein [Candidatus Woesebacteria bacterium GW2011_GWD1_31_12]KKP27174.1 MAG: Helix-turn-helix domain protein [Candidatus Woesebacteria bacterium GW2011_GWB1_31_29]KKP30087.1 MAG: Helix-turn-helix domain protein [Candidatus Woesebacteria bacterium GW2011_GWE2_31_